VISVATTTSVKAPNFGDDAVAALPPIRRRLREPRRAAGSSTRSPRIVWRSSGAISPARNDDSDGDIDAKPASWVGSISVAAGAVDVIRTLSFDDGDAIDARTIQDRHVRVAPRSRSSTA